MPCALVVKYGSNDVRHGVGGEARAAVGDRHAHRRPSLQAGGRQRHEDQRTASDRPVRPLSRRSRRVRCPPSARPHRVHRVQQQVLEGAPQRLVVAAHQRHGALAGDPGADLGRHRRAGQALDQLRQVHGRGRALGQPPQRRELARHLLDAPRLAVDDLEQLALVGARVRVQAPHREAQRGERVLELVRDLARDVAEGAQLRRLDLARPGRLEFARHPVEGVPQDLELRRAARLGRRRQRRAAGQQAGPGHQFVDGPRELAREGRRQLHGAAADEHGERGREAAQDAGDRVAERLHLARAPQRRGDLVAVPLDREPRRRRQPADVELPQRGAPRVAGPFPGLDAADGGDEVRREDRDRDGDRRGDRRDDHEPHEDAAPEGEGHGAILAVSGPRSQGTGPGKLVGGGRAAIIKGWY